MRDKLKLKHVDVLAEVDESKRDLSSLMLDVFDWKYTFFGRRKKFLDLAKKSHELAIEVSQIDYKEIKVNDNSHIVKPGNLDAISYLAMLDLLGEKSKGSSEDNLALHIANVNAIATYEENIESKYSITSKSFKRYRDLSLIHI